MIRGQTYRNKERKRLATPRLRRAQYITALQRERDRLALDIRQRLEMRLMQSRRRLLRQRQFRELCSLQILFPPITLALLLQWFFFGGGGYNTQTPQPSSPAPPAPPRPACASGPLPLPLRAS